FARDGKRGRESDHLMMGLFGEHSAFRKPLAERACRAGLGLYFKAYKKAFAAHLFDMKALYCPQSVDEVLAQLSSPLVQMLIDYNVESRLSAGRSQRIAAECAAVISRSEYVHHGSIGKHRRYGIDPASKRLAEYQNIRLYPFILECKHFACASESGLYL